MLSRFRWRVVKAALPVWMRCLWVSSASGQRSLVHITSFLKVSWRSCSSWPRTSPPAPSALANRSAASTGTTQPSIRRWSPRAATPTTTRTTTAADLTTTPSSSVIPFTWSARTRSGSQPTTWSSRRLWASWRGTTRPCSPRLCPRTRCSPSRSWASAPPIRYSWSSRSPSGAPSATASSSCGRMRLS